MASTQKKILQYHIARLQNRQRDVRLASIHELEDMGDPDALAPLQRVFETDSDIEVRRAAQSAGLKIYRKSRGTD